MFIYICFIFYSKPGNFLTPLVLSYLTYSLFVSELMNVCRQPERLWPASSTPVAGLLNACGRPSQRLSPASTSVAWPAGPSVARPGELSVAWRPDPVLHLKMLCEFAYAIICYPCPVMGILMINMYVDLILG
jgi:hypothetical protein